MSIAFYALSGSPFTWKVWLALEHKQLAYDLHVLSAEAGDLKKPEFLRLNPRGKVPAVADNGFVLYESATIVEYLEDRYPECGAPLWPQNVKDKAQGRRMAEEAGHYVYPGVRTLVGELLMRRDGNADDAAIAAAKAALSQELSALGEKIAGPYLLGAAPSAADYALYPLTALLKRVDARQPGYGIGGVVSASVATWMRNVEALPYFAKTIPPHWRAASCRTLLQTVKRNARSVSLPVLDPA